MKKLTILAFIFCFLTGATHAQSIVPFGDVRLGSAPLPIDLKAFIPHASPSSKKLELHFAPNSLQWIRDSSNLLVPRARLNISYKSNDKNPPLFYYHDQVFAGEFKEDSATYHIDLWVNLFNPGKITVKKGDQVIHQIATRRHHFKESQKTKKETQLIDYSCAPYDVKFEGLEDQYLSVGCRLEKLSEGKGLVPRLVITWSASDALLVDATLPPYRTVLRGDASSVMEVINAEGDLIKVKISAKLPKRIHRLKTAIGFGPYLFESQSGSRVRPEKWAPAFMLYGKYDLMDTTSLRFFNATVSRGSTFNNGGLYLAYEIASVFDGRVQVIPLLGAQFLTFDYNNDVPERNKIIYPQGFEVVWKHSFGLKNTTMIYGMFISGSDTEPYKNLWLRWGTRIFGELNYIEWSHGSQKVKTYGLSVGLPLFSFF